MFTMKSSSYLLHSTNSRVSSPRCQFLWPYTNGANESHVTLEYITDGERIEIECSAAEYDAKNLMFFKDQVEITTAALIRGKTKILKINQFDGGKHAGIYQCVMPASNEALESTLMLKRYNPLVSSPHVKECEENMCRNGGKCFVPFTGDKAPFCLCPPEYAGQYCESHAISSYTVQSPQAGILIWSLALTVLSMLLLIFLLLFFIHRYSNERSKRKMYQNQYGKLPDFKNSGAKQSEITASFLPLFLSLNSEMFDYELVDMSSTTINVQPHSKTDNFKLICESTDELEDFENLDVPSAQNGKNSHQSAEKSSSSYCGLSGFRERLNGTSTFTTL
ncbi:unnamed protein product [Thelazia callipaeda]|uniref:EGF-like domain-containing protein n=1 Tax=Thelazia callipaeda TaxID=103827 RepID=A0A158RBA5_THECL|nr:unnamed protein product [Thelazia callipaeda]